MIAKLNRLCYASALVVTFASLGLPALAEPLGNPPTITSGNRDCPPPSSAKYLFYDTTNGNYVCDNTTALPQVLINALGGSAPPVGDPGGYVKLLPFIASPPPTGGFPASSYCILGTFPSSGDQLQICTPLLADWNTTVSGGNTLARQYFNDFFAAPAQNFPSSLFNIVVQEYGECLNIPDISAIESAIYSDFLVALPLYSNPAPTYANQNVVDDSIAIGLAGIFDATPTYAQALSLAFASRSCTSGIKAFNFTRLQGFQLQFTEVIKATLNGEPPLYLYSFSGTQTGRYQNDPSCTQNQNSYKWIYGPTSTPDPTRICSGSGNYEVVIKPSPPPLPVPAVSPLTLAGSVVGLVLISLARLRRRGSRL